MNPRYDVHIDNILWELSVTEDVAVPLRCAMNVILCLLPRFPDPPLSIALLSPKNNALNRRGLAAPHFLACFTDHFVHLPINNVNEDPVLSPPGFVAAIAEHTDPAMPSPPSPSHKTNL